MVATLKAESKPDPAAHYHRQRLAEGGACLQAALDYLGRGWAALALCTPDHVGVGRTHGQQCQHPGKAPWGPWKAYQTQLPTEEELRRKWQANPQLNVGMTLGGITGLVGLDVDEEGGEELLARLSGGNLPPTLAFTSGKGRRLLYAAPPGVRLQLTPKPGGLEIKRGELRLLGLGSQTVMPPSRHRDSGRLYAWQPGHGPGEIEPAPAPAWMLKLMRAGAVGNGTKDTPCTGAHPTQQLGAGAPCPGEGAIYSVCCVGGAPVQVDGEGVRRAIEHTLPSGPRQRNRKLFELARRLWLLPSFPHAPARKLRTLVKDWHSRALPVLGTKPFDATWEDFQVAWERLRPAGTGPIWDLMQAACTKHPRRPDQQLLDVCAALQAHAGVQPFFLSCRTAGRLLGVHHSVANEKLRVLEARGVLKRVRTGDAVTYLANVYHYRGGKA
jgi:hypothetical protein